MQKRDTPQDVSPKITLLSNTSASFFVQAEFLVPYKITLLSNIS